MFDLEDKLTRIVLYYKRRNLTKIGSFYIVLKHFQFD